ncbi:MAG TPA: PHB depolymerase family esterase [Polyangiaceae bacterium]|nr:PHB depolymerase family esterase [Polyangiaceae bacterium]
MTRYRHHLAALLTLNAGLLCAAAAHAGSWTADAPFGATLKGDLYTPTTPAAKPAILVVIHMCTGHSTTVHGWFDSFADQNGFYLIAPDAGKQCFDSSASRDGDKAAIVKMVDYVVTNKNADKTRVFAAGMSSGGCMTNTLLAVYPDIFVGGSAMPGFPAGGWPSGDTTCTKCGSSPPSTDGKYWGDIARKAFTWSGTYPCSQQWVGGGDEYNFNGWLPAVAAQFQNLSNLTGPTDGTGAPSGWTRKVYKDAAGNVRLETNLGPTSQKHDLETVNPTLYGKVVTFLGLDKPTGACGVTMTGTGGSTGSAGASGAAGGSGGASSTSGGTSSSGGASTGTGGTSSAGSSNTSTAGSSPSAGGPGSSTAGAPASGGSPATGTAGATASSAGSAGSGNAGGGFSRDSGGCSFDASGQSSSGAIAGFLAAALGAVFARRRRARS